LRPTNEGGRGGSPPLRRRFTDGSPSFSAKRLRPNITNSSALISMSEQSIASGQEFGRRDSDPADPIVANLEQLGGVLRGCLTARQQGISHHLFDAEKQGWEIGGIFQMPADVVGTGGAKNTTHFDAEILTKNLARVFTSSFRCGKTGVLRISAITSRIHALQSRSRRTARGAP
jgi:hypothetical protein